MNIVYVVISALDIHKGPGPDAALPTVWKSLHTIALSSDPFQ